MDTPTLGNGKLEACPPQPFTIKYNHYICDTCRQTTAVREIDEGTTPFYIGCRKCKVKEARCQSTFYSCPQIEQRVDFEFYRMKPATTPDGVIVESDQMFEARLRMMTPEEREHHNKGGLFMRPYDPPLRMRQRDIIKVYFSKEDPTTIYLVRNSLKEALFQDCMIVCKTLPDNGGYQVVNIIEQQVPPGCVQTHWSPGARE